MTIARLLLLMPLVLATLAPSVSRAQEADPVASLAERLGYPSDARLLLVHMDDIGVAHSVNQASIDAFETGRVPSGSIMAPCPWFPEIAAYARDHPDFDLGLHLTLMDLLTPQDIVIDHFAMAAPQVPADQWDTFYTGLLENFQPGVTEIIIHAALDNAEMRAVTIDHPDYGAAWRQRDLDFFTRDAFKHLLKQHDIPLITWREIGPFFRK